MHEMSQESAREREESILTLSRAHDEEMSDR
jgi:hypothetical protein